jgi:alkanesulfonate monooxygenase SsuD/methylene tetrahydromethanopterin reductase-like flavin-dependent oxidoreductase (luciferase family)
VARTVDHISGGRLILCLGSGWYEKDYTLYSYDYGTVSSRMALFEDGLQRIENRLEQLQPRPLRRIPIPIGGSGERRTLPLVGKRADIWHSFPDIETFRRKNDLVREHAAAAGRDEAQIERAIDWPGTRPATPSSGPAGRRWRR